MDTAASDRAISRTSLTDAEAAIGNVAMLGSRRDLAAVWSLANADRILASIPAPQRYGFFIVQATRGANAWLVTDGYWYVG